MRLWQCYDTIYSNRAIDFIRDSTVTLFGDNLQRLPRDPEAMVGCHGVRRLFMLDCPHGEIADTAIHRVDPATGRVEDVWGVDRNSVALSTVADDQLLLTMPGRLEHYNADGRLLRTIITRLQGPHAFQEASLLQDSMTILLFC